MRIRSLALARENFGNQWADEALDRWHYDDFTSRPNWRNGWISFDCAHYEAQQQRVYLGITSFAADIFKAYDRSTDQFIDLGYHRVANPFDATFHRSLERSSDGGLYGAVALLHDVDRFFEAPGGAIVRYDIHLGTTVKLCVPIPHVYIQSIALDDKRCMIYGVTFAPERFISYNLSTGESRDYGLISSSINGMVQGENVVLDDDGCAWTAWGLTRAWQDSAGVDHVRLCKLDPVTDRLTFLQTGLPYPDGRPGYVRPEGFMNLGDGFIYISGYNGSLYRVDRETGRAVFLFMPVDRPSRLTSLAITSEGVAYGVTGKRGDCEFMRVDYRRGSFELLGRIKDADGEPLWQCHQIIAASDSLFYICENDNPGRSSRLWEIEL
jgi:hypothetical protein